MRDSKIEVGAGVTAISCIRESVTISGNDGDDAKQYQERAVKRAIEESEE